MNGICCSIPFTRSIHYQRFKQPLSYEWHTGAARNRRFPGVFSPQSSPVVRFLEPRFLPAVLPVQSPPLNLSESDIRASLAYAARRTVDRE